MPTSTNIIAIGELLWDVFPDQQRLGGAPANFAIHCAQLSGDNHTVALVSAVGEDDLGAAALASINKTKVNTDLLSAIPHPTGQVIVTLDGNGTPSYEIAADVAWDYLPGSDALTKAASRAHAVCFGTLAQRSPVSRAVIQKTVSATSESCFDSESLLGKLQQRFDLAAIAYTRGEHGAVLIRGDEISHCPGLPTSVIDTVGAGDAFTAALVLGLLEKRSLDEINERACKIAAFVCSQNGATPKVPSSLLA